MVTSQPEVQNIRILARWACLVTLLGLWLVLPQTTTAHATLLSTTPSDGASLDSMPSEAVLTFSEDIGLVDGGMSLFGTDIEKTTLEPTVDGHEITISLDSQLPDGNYVLQWRVISADSHVLSGAVSFTVGEGTGGAVQIDELPGWLDVARVITVAAKYIGLLAAAGLLLIVRFIDRRELAVALPKVMPAIVLALTGTILELPFAAFEQLGRIPGDLQGMLAAIRQFDNATLTAAGLSAGFAIIALIGVKFGSTLPVASVALVGALVAQLLNGHTRTKDPTWLMMSGDAIHLIAGAIWLGGIVFLTLGLTGKWPGKVFATIEQASRSVARFSTVAGYASALVLVSGVTMAVTILRSWDALWHTDYGNSLLLKVFLVLFVILIAGANRFVFIPRLPTGNSLIWLRRLVTAELVLVIAVAGVTARLVQQDPNVAAEIQPIVLYQGESALDDGHTLHLIVERNESLEIEMIATIISEDGDVVQLEDDVTIAWYQPEQELGPIVFTLALSPTNGSYHGTGQVPITGTWKLTVRASIDQFTDSRTTIEIVVPD